MLAAREVSSNPLFVGFPNAVGVGGAVIGTRMIYLISKSNSQLNALAFTFLIGAFGGAIMFYPSLIIDSFLLLLLGAFLTPLRNWSIGNTSN